MNLLYLNLCQLFSDTEPTEKSDCLSKSSDTSGYDSDTESSSSDDEETSGCWPTSHVLAQKSKLL